MQATDIFLFPTLKHFGLIILVHFQAPLEGDLKYSHFNCIYVGDRKTENKESSPAKKTCKVRKMLAVIVV